MSMEIYLIFKALEHEIRDCNLSLAKIDINSIILNDLECCIRRLRNI